MNNWLRKLAIFVGIGMLVVSVYWSQDGFNFSLAGDSGGGNFALYFGWFIAFAVCVIQFVFSTNYKELNPSLLLFGFLAYIYSIYTNYQGIIHFQGTTPSPIGAGILAFFMDAVPEPLIAWGLYESLQGDLIGNMIKWVNSSPTQKQPQTSQQREQRHNEMRQGNFQWKSDKISHDRLKPKSNVPPFLINRK